MYMLFQEKHILPTQAYTRKWPGLCKSVFMITFNFNLARPKYKKLTIFYFQKEIGMHASIVLYFDFITCLSLVTY